MICIGLIGALDQEVSALVRQMTETETKTIASMDFHRGILWGQEAVVVKSGVGKVNIAVCTQILVNIYEVDILINTGVAGGMHRDVHIGDIVISSDTLQHDFDVTGDGFARGEIPGMPTSIFTADPELVDMAREACEIVNDDIHCFVGRVLTGDRFVSTTADKAEVLRYFDAYCVEMEGAAMAQVAYLNKIPFVIIRAISDQADDNAAQVYPLSEEKAIIHTVKLLAAMFVKMGK